MEILKFMRKTLKVDFYTHKFVVNPTKESKKRARISWKPFND